MSDSDKISAYYAPPDLMDRIVAALQRAGIDPDHVDYTDLLAFDQFHIGGVEQTRAMAGAAGLKPGMRVLDIGCAIGGSSRVLAAEFGAEMVGVDPVGEFIQVATRLTGSAGLDSRVSFTTATAPGLPFDQSSFDLIWVQLVLMNIADKRKFFEECTRLLAPGGSLAVLDVVGKDEGELHYPVLWADRPELSHLIPEFEYASILSAAGFDPTQVNDFTDRAIVWFDSMRERRRNQTETERALSTALIISGEAGRKSANVRRNLAEGKIGVVEIIARSHA